MTKIQRLFFGVFFTASVGIVHANSQQGLSVTMAGSESNAAQVYVGISPNPDACYAGGVYFVNPNEVNTTLSVAMAAKLSGKTIRIDYNQPAGPGNMCYGYSIYVQ